MQGLRHQRMIGYLTFADDILQVARSLPDSGRYLHCSGANSMVLEISATPYIFTFKLWDWARLGLDGEPRPVNIERGSKVIQWDRDET